MADESFFSEDLAANCVACHLVGEKSALFADNKFHDIAVGVQSGKITDPGRYAVMTKLTVASSRLSHSAISASLRPTCTMEVCKACR